MPQDNGRLPSYVVLSRGIKPYLKAYSGNEVKVYNYLIIGAEWREGPDKGIWTGPPSELVKGCNLSYKTVVACLATLSLGIFAGRGGTAPPFIEVLEDVGQTKGKVLRIRILKAKLTARDFHRLRKDVITKTTKAHENKVASGLLGDIISGLAGKMDISKKGGKR